MPDNKIIVADCAPLYREGIKGLFAKTGGLSTLFECGNIGSVISLLTNSDDYDLIIIEGAMLAK